MRRLVFPVILASGLVVLGAVPASAEPAPEATVKAAAGKKVCKVTDPLLNELSGIVATGDGYAVINDGTDSSAREKVFFLDEECDIQNRVGFSGRGPADTEDLVLSPDGKTLWIADTGDNGVRERPPTHRETISVWSMPVDGSKEPTVHRLTYPDGDYHDAEALLLDGQGKPLIVTKELSGTALVYTPASALKKNNTEGVPLKKVGQVQLPRTTTPGTAFARLAQGVVTGGAVSPDGKKVVLRTYLDAFEWDVTNGDVVGALKNKPRVTGLPNEPFGEAITYSADGKTFATASDFGDIEDEGTANYILRYTPATQFVTANADGTAKAEDKGPSWFSQLSLSDITYLVGGIGVLGALLVGAGIFGIVRSRKKPLAEPDTDDDDDEPTGPKPSDAQTELLAVGGAPRTAAAASGPVYGAKPPKGTGVYGAGGGRPAQGGAPAPAGRPGGASAGRPSAAPAGRPGAAQPARPGAAQPGRPASGQPVRPAGGEPVRPAGGQPGRPAGQPARPAGGQPARPTGQPARPAGGQPARPAGGAPVRPGQGAQRRPGGGGQAPRPAGGQSPRPAGGGGAGRPPGGQPGRPGSGVYGAPPPPPPTGGRQGSAGPSRPAGFGAPGTGHPGQAPSRPNGAINMNGNPRARDGRSSYGR